MTHDAPQSEYSYSDQRQILFELVHNLIDRLTLLAHKIADNRHDDPLSEREWDVLINTACQMLYHRSARWKH